MRPLMPLRSVSSLLSPGGPTICPRMGVIGWSHLVATRNSMAVGHVRAVTHVTVPGHCPCASHFKQPLRDRFSIFVASLLRLK